MRTNNRGQEKGTVDQIFRAAGDPHRIQIIRLLSEKRMSAGELLESLDIVQSTLSHHMKSLTEAGVVDAVKQGKWTYYTVNSESLRNAASCLTGLAELSAQTNAGQAETSEAAGEGRKAAAPSANAAPDKAAEEDRKKKGKKSKKGRKGKKS